MPSKRKTYTAYDTDEDMLSTCSSDMDYDMEQESPSLLELGNPVQHDNDTLMLILKMLPLIGGMVIMVKK